MGEKMDKPWTKPGWTNLEWHERWEQLKAYLAACPNWTVRAEEIYPYDAQMAFEIENYGGKVLVCHHGTLSFPGMPCDDCWEEMERNHNQ
jgi:hypothetical protein